VLSFVDPWIEEEVTFRYQASFVPKV
jgi:hypothetical protein